MNQDSKNLVISVAAGLMAAFLVFSYSQEKKAEYDREYGAKKQVVVARKNLLEMQTIDDEAIEIVEIPQKFIQPGAVTNPETIIGQVVAAPVAKGEQIMFNKLLQPGADTGISYQIAPNKRAVTLPIDESRAVGKLIRPGDRVDVVVALDVGKGLQAKREVLTLLTDIPVLATGANIVGNIPRVVEYDPSSRSVVQTVLTGDTRYSTITLEVSPKEAQDLIYILSTNPSSIYLTLRNPADKAVLPRMPASSAEVLSISLGLSRPAEGGNPMINIPPRYQGGQ